MITFAQLGKYGRLGNGMFQIASTIGIARRFGYQFAFPEWKNHDHKTRFGSTEDIDIQKYFLNPLPFTDDPTKFPDYPMQWGYHGDYIPDNVSLSGHMQSERYFKHCEQDIRHYFRMKDPYPKSDWCAIHVRLGDYDDNYHPRLTMEYYRKAMSHFHESTNFLVFSDDKWAATEMFGNKATVFAGGDYMDDFTMMRSCKHFIIGNSTFSWWPAWLGEDPDKKVIAPSNWFGAAWGSNYKTMADDIYAGNWIVI